MKFINRYKNKYTHFLLLAILACAGAACKKKSPAEPESIIDPGDANALSRVVIIPDARRVNGTPPDPTSGSNTPTVGSNQSQQTSSNGSTALLPFRYATATDLSGCYVWIEGANSYFRVPYTDPSSTAGSITIPLTIPTNVAAGQFCVSYCVYDAEGRVSNIVQTCVNVLSLGTGDLQISLSWDTGVDLDLHVTDPQGERINWLNSISESGGNLDRDDTDGFGPENIFWLSNTPNGEFLVEVNHYSGLGDTQYTATINSLGVSKKFSGNISNGRRKLITTIVKSGDSIRFK